MIESNCLENPSQHVGCKWRLWTKCDGIVEGILSDYYPGNLSFTFDKSEAIQENGDNEYIGTLGIFRNEVLDAVVIDRDEAVRSQYIPLQQPTLQNDDLSGYFISKRDLTNSTDNSSSAGDNSDSEADDDEVIQIIPDNLENVSINFNSHYWQAPFSENIEYIFKRTADEKVDEAMDDINSQNMIGVAAIGNDITRFGFIECILISTNNCNYAFCEDEWINLLKPKLQSPKVIKLMFGSPAIVDLLLKKYGIRMTGVADLQFLELCVRDREQNQKKQQSGKQLVVRKYSDCLRDYLNVDVPSILCEKNFTNIKATHPSEMFDLFCKLRVMPLKQLRWCLLTKFMEDVDFSMQLFVHSLSGASDAEYNALTELYRVNCASLIQRRSQLPPIPLPERIYSEEITFQTKDMPNKEIEMRQVNNSVFNGSSYQQEKNYKRVEKLLSDFSKPFRLPKRGPHSLSSCEEINSNSSDDCQIIDDTSQLSETSPSFSSSISSVRSSSSVENVYRSITQYRSNIDTSWPVIQNRSSDTADFKYSFAPAGSESSNLMNQNCTGIRYHDSYTLD